MMFSRFVYHVNTAASVLSCVAKVGFSALKLGAKSVSFLWGVSGMKEVTTPYVEPIQNAVLDMYVSNTVITKVALGKMDPNVFSQSKYDEMAKEKTYGEIAIITVLMAIQLSLALAIIPFYFVLDLFMAPKVEAVW